MKHTIGNLITLAEEGHFDFIIHGCNCFCNMGRGIALEIRNKYPGAYEADCMTTKEDFNKLGTYSIYQTVRGFYIINAYTQYDWRGKNIVNANYEAIRAVFRLIKANYGGKEYRFGIPAIGAGLAGGDWNIISKIVDEEMAGEDITFVEWDGK